MAQAKFSIGIDLGTTNCAMAFEALDETPSRTELFPIPQLETITAFVEASTLPSFLYLPPKKEIDDLAGTDADSDRWIPGRLARKKAAESPGRVAHSANPGFAIMRLIAQHRFCPGDQTRSFLIKGFLQFRPRRFCLNICVLSGTPGLAKRV